MGEVIDFQAALRKRFVKGCVALVTEFYAEARSIAEEYAILMDKDPEEGVARIREYIHRMRDGVNTGGIEIETYAGGPNPDWTTAILNVVGCYYATFEHPLREKTLRHALRFLDSIRYDYAQSHVEMIHDPWLAGDISISRAEYWPGYREYTDKLTGSVTEYLNKAKSVFFATMPVTRLKYATPKFRKEYYEQYPVLVDQTLDVIAGLTQTHAEHRLKRDGTPIEQYVESHLLRFDPALHERIREKITERKWIELP